MKERPILFSATMVRAILEGGKTVTRRIVKPQPREEDGQIYGGEIFGPEMYEPATVDKHGEMVPGPEIFGIYTEDGDWGVKCPYGQPGDRLWVRETFCRDKWAMGYRADGACGCWGYDGDGNRIFNEHGRLSENAKGFVPTRFPHVYGDRWIPSIHMPREASRIDLEITSVRVERLQKISEEDAVAEGIGGDFANYTSFQPNVSSFAFAKDSYRSLWESINGPGSWDENPWVWVLEFRRVKP